MAKKSKLPRCNQVEININGEKRRGIVRNKKHCAASCAWYSPSISAKPACVIDGKLLDLDIKQNIYIAFAREECQKAVLKLKSGK